ncbi:BON domain-containing protein [Salinarimonas soli]|uniref:BON domain-containing protein n=1 Tax=Salinarimonas soli TaxID=1638099 RepID=A0A5B2VDZ6_9HYPH|nr:BON domain-containing protein [Salinarimonas soli]KAA2237005.1 BON domain-containing protein [Salinarimonas soli]
MPDDTKPRRNDPYSGSPAGYGGGGFGTSGYGGGLRGEADRHVSGPVHGERDRRESIGGNGYAGDRTDGPHRGRGPKGYRRSDERILEDVSDRLMEDPHVDARAIEVRVEEGEITLEGTVGSRWEKRHSEDIAEAVSGVSHVQNNLRVRENTAFGKEEMSPERQPDEGRGHSVAGRSRPR